MGNPGLRPLPDPARHERGRVAAMFSAIAPTYDLLNTLLSLSLHKRWKRRAVQALNPKDGELFLDLCTGTGDLALALRREADARVVGVDFSEGMLAAARRKASRDGAVLFLRGDAESLPFVDGSVDGAMVAFGVRNFEDLDHGLEEIARVVKDGGGVVVLEFSKPDGRLFGALFGFYFHRVLPLVGRLVSRSRGAYAYLPASVECFPDSAALGRRFFGAGMKVVDRTPFTGGVATLYRLRKTGGERTEIGPVPGEGGAHG